MSTYPIAYEQHPPVERDRLTVFFRGLMCIPHAIVSWFYGIGLFVVEVAAWVTILCTGRFPQGMYDFVVGYLRFYTRYCAYALLIVDDFPPFDGGEHPGYPVRVRSTAYVYLITDAYPPINYTDVLLPAGATS